MLRTGMLALLLPVLLLLPTFHTHPEQRHTHGHESTHAHPAVAHTDVFAHSAHGHNEHNDHDEHDQGHGPPDEHSSQSDFRLNLFTFLPRSFVLLTPALERVPPAFPTPLPALTQRLIPLSWVYLANHPPPVEPGSFPAISPRSPPHHV